jgi:hypothetical protein
MKDRETIYEAIKRTDDLLREADNTIVKYRQLKLGLIQELNLKKIYPEGVFKPKEIQQMERMYRKELSYHKIASEIIEPVLDRLKESLKDDTITSIEVAYRLQEYLHTATRNQREW